MATEHTSRSPRDSRFILIPALTFIVGLLLGGVLVWVGADVVGDDQDEPAVTATAQPTESGAGADPGQAEPTDVTMTVPGECIEAAEQAQEVLTLARQAADAIGELDAQRLRTLVDEMEQLEPAIRTSAGQCQDEREG